MEEMVNMLPPQQRSLSEKHRWDSRRILETMGFVMALSAVALFSWRVFSFYRNIQSGAINPALGYTTTDFTRAAHAFAKKAAEGAGSGSLATIDDPTLGTKTPKITLVEFADFGCPYSQENAPIVRAIAKQYSADVQIIYRDFPLEDLHPGATIAAQGGGCANEQGKFWEYHDAVFALKEILSVEAIFSVADRLELDMDDFQRCMESDFYTKDVEGDIADGAAAGVVGTPTFFFNGEKVEGSIPFTVFNQIINAMRQT
jgi:protein-disulfide isomerase